MDGVVDIEKARELVGNAALWPRVRDFLWDFAAQVHESWLDGSVVSWSGIEEADRSSSHPTAQPTDYTTTQPPSWRIKKFILDSLGVEPCFHDFPKDDGSRIALLDGATLLEVAKWLGALAYAEDLRKVTDGATVRALKAALPGVYPEVFGYTAYFGGLDSILTSCRDAEAQKVDERVVLTGYEILVSALAGLPAPLVSRLKFKFPKTLCDSASPREMKGAVVLPAILKLLKLKFPEAYALCSS